jgi:ribonuclease H2 subunit C
LKVPKGYRGAVLLGTDRVLPKGGAGDKVEDDEDAEEEPETKIMEEQSEFEDIMIWGHESLPEEGADPYMKGIEEWIAFADQVRLIRCVLEILLIFIDQFVRFR